MTEVKYKSESQPTNHIPYLALTGELRDVFWENLGENWPCYNGIALYIALCCVWFCNGGIDHLFYHHFHYSDVKMSSVASQITSVSHVWPTVCSGTDQRKYKSSQSLSFVRGIHRSPVNSPHNKPVTRKMFTFDDVIVNWRIDNRTMTSLQMCNPKTIAKCITRTLER